MGEVEEAFIQAVEHRPKLSVTEAKDIPIIDLSVLTNPSSTNIDNLVSEMRNACKNWGFFVVTNHGVPLETRQKMENMSRKFFALPLEEKGKVSRDKKLILGYYDGEYTKNVRDWKEVFDFVVHNPMRIPLSPAPDDKEIAEMYNQWPVYPREFREACEEFGKEMDMLACKVMELIALSLGLPANRFESFFTEKTSKGRLNHYPLCPVPQLALGVGRHKDSCSLSIVAEDIGGLEVKRKSDGEWVLVKSAPDSYIINIGEIIQVWTNDTYESMEHRVILNSGQERYSFSFGFYPAHFTMVQPLDEMVNEQNPAKYRAYNCGKLFASRRLSNFMKHDAENIQVTQFKVQE